MCKRMNQDVMKAPTPGEEEKELGNTEKENERRAGVL
jgi:hypothetical protein